MAADWVTLFDLELAKAVVQLDRPGLERFLAERSPGFVERDQRNARARAAEFAARLPAIDRAAAARFGLEPETAEASAARVATALRDLEEQGCRDVTRRWEGFAEHLSGDEPLQSLRVEVAWAAGTVDDRLILDYWACFVEVLMPLKVDRTCESNLALDPDDLDGEYVYFLQAQHADAMIASLRAHWSEVTVMKEPQLQRLVAYRDRCAADGSLRVAYHIDL